VSQLTEYTEGQSWQTLHTDDNKLWSCDVSYCTVHCTMDGKNKLKR